MHSRPGSTGSSQQVRTAKDSVPEAVPLPLNLPSEQPLRQHTRNAHSSSNSIHRPKPLTTPSKPLRVLPSTPASPPTPAPSPTPHQRVPSWQQHQSCEDEDAFIREAASNFVLLGKDAQQRFLKEILNLCGSRQLGFVQQYVSPMLKRDPFKVLPNELCLRVLSFIDDPKTLARAAQVSPRWYELLNADITWKVLCDKHVDGLSSEDDWADDSASTTASESTATYSLPSPTSSHSPLPNLSNLDIMANPAKVAEEMARMRASRPHAGSYRTKFKRKYMVDAAWRKGGNVMTKCVTIDQGVVVTNLHLTRDHILVALDNAKIHVFGRNGEHQRILQGHMMGVWATVPCDNILVSGGCDRDVRVWDIETGECKHRLRGHTSTVRCLKMVDNTTAISGSRDGTLRVWDISAGVCLKILSGHSASVRCLEVYGDLVVSGSYDTTARLWNISEGRCLRTMTGHFSQIYAIAFDGKRIATGSLDTSVRVWDPQTGQCQAVLQGHTSLVGQLQMKDDILVTGGSDGSIRVWSLQKFAPIHRLAAHDNSITSLQFDGNRIMSGGSDGRVRIWDATTGQPVRELGQPADSVWRVGFEAERAVVMATRGGRMVMEVWSFSPPPEKPQPSLGYRPAYTAQDIEMHDAY